MEWQAGSPTIYVFSQPMNSTRRLRPLVLSGNTCGAPIVNEGSIVPMGSRLAGRALNVATLLWCSMTPFEWVVSLVLASVVLSLDFALIKVIIRASGDFTEMVKQLGMLVGFTSSMNNEIKQLRVEFGELRKSLEVANGIKTDDKVSIMAGGDD